MLSVNYYYKKLFIIIIIIVIIIIMCLIFNFYIPFLTSVEVDEEDEGRPEMPLERESFPEYEGKQRK